MLNSKKSLVVSDGPQSQDSTTRTRNTAENAGIGSVSDNGVRIGTTLFGMLASYR